MKAWADQLNAAVKQEATPEQRAEWAKRNAADQAAREKHRRDKMAEFSANEVLQEFGERMTDHHRATWDAWGVPAEWQKHLRLGFQPDKIYRGDDGELHHSAAYTIPYFHTGYDFQTMQYRLFEPPTDGDRYRFEQGLGAAYYQAEPNAPIGDQVIICEGAKKAMVVQIYGGQEKLSALAVPSKGTPAGVAEAVAGCGRVYVLLDPDAGFQARKLAKSIGNQARVVTVPVKVDDGIIRHGMTARDLGAYIRQAI